MIESMNINSRVYVAGHRGLVGSAICRGLRARGFTCITADHAALDLTRQSDVEQFFRDARPEFVFLAAAKVGGIKANMENPAAFIRDNLLISANVIEASFWLGAKLLYLGSSCIYPRLAPQPIPESALLSGPPEPTNRAYAIAKIAGIEMVDAYRKQHGFRAISVMPCNVYGPGDNFDLESSHVLSAMIRRLHDAKKVGVQEVEFWGTGQPRREFIHVDDLADACAFLMQYFEGDSPINVGVGEDVTISELADTIKKIVGYSGEIKFGNKYPDGIPRKIMDDSRMRGMGWVPRIRLLDGIKSTYSWFLENEA